MKSVFSDDEVFETHDDGSPALYLRRGQYEELLLCDANECVPVESDAEIRRLVSEWRANVLEV